MQRLLLVATLAVALFGVAVNAQCSAGDRACFCKKLGGEWRPQEGILAPTCRVYYNHQGMPKPCLHKVSLHCLTATGLQQQQQRNSWQSNSSATHTQHLRTSFHISAPASHRPPQHCSIQHTPQSCAVLHHRPEALGTCVPALQL